MTLASAALAATVVRFNLNLCNFDSNNFNLNNFIKKKVKSK